MFDINESVVRIVADDTQAAVAATDDALLAGMHLFASVLAGARNTNVPISVTQPIYRHLATSAARIVEGREELATTIRLLTKVKRDSDHRELMVGCPEGLPDLPSFFTEAHKHKLAQVMGQFKPVDPVASATPGENRPAN